MKPVFMPPDAATLMWSTRAIGYTTPSAIADLIDNSISAIISDVNIFSISTDSVLLIQRRESTVAYERYVLCLTDMRHIK